MTEAEHARISEIESEFVRMGVTSEWVSEYVRLCTFYPDPTHAMLPNGFMQHDVYIKRLNDLVQNLEKAKKQVSMCPATALVAAKQKQIVMCNAAQHELYRHLTLFKPVDPKSFYATLNALIDEKMCILTNIRIIEASNIMGPV